MQTTTSNQEEWLQIMESGKFKQCSQVLFSITRDEYCCLGLATFHVSHMPLKGTMEAPADRSMCAYTGENVAPCWAVMPESVVQELGFYDCSGEILITSRTAFHEALAVAGFKVPHVRSNLAAYNDDGATFTQLAAAIRALPHAVFKP